MKVARERDVRTGAAFYAGQTMNTPPPHDPSNLPPRDSRNELARTAETWADEARESILATARDVLLTAGEGKRNETWIPRGRWGLVVIIVLILFVGGMFGGSVPQLSAGMGLGLNVAFLFGTLQTVPFVVAGGHPLTAWRLLTLGMMASTWTSGLFGLYWPWPATSCVTYMLCIALISLRQPRRILLGVWLVSALAVIYPMMYLAGMNVLVASSLVAAIAVVLALGDSIRTRWDLQRVLTEQEKQHKADRARTAELEDREAVLVERSRIARELHDVVAHHMSMISIQAQAAPYKIPDLSPQAVETFEAIRSAASTALTEMRRVIGLLRDDGEEAEREPQPGLEQVSDLIDGARRAGMSVDVTMTGEARPIPPAVDMSAYRIVQEALSNASRHAPRARVYVEVAHGPVLLRIRIRNEAHVGHDGPMSQPRAAHGASLETGLTATPPDEPVADAPGGGHGLVGMRERVTMLGGEFDAGPHPEGGFEVRAVLPIQPVDATAQPAGAGS